MTVEEVPKDYTGVLLLKDENDSYDVVELKKGVIQFAGAHVDTKEEVLRLFKNKQGYNCNYSPSLTRYVKEERGVGIVSVEPVTEAEIVLLLL